jgi:polar amino acid transport system ATP-binding protein
MLFDEVTSALDPELVGEVLQVIRDLARSTSMAMMLVTHEISFAADIADRIIVLDHGKIVEEGPPSVVLREPRSQRTQQFLRAILER